MNASELIDGWRARAAEHGFDAADLGRVLGRARIPRLDGTTVERAFAGLAAPTGLTRRASTFSRRDVLQGLCERLPAGAGVDAISLEVAADRFLASSRVVALLPEAADLERGEVFRRRDGRLLPLAEDELTYSTPELLALEQRVIERALTTRGAGACVTAAEGVAAAGVSRPTLSDEQRTMVDRLCLAGDGVAMVVGRAGTGKTFALGAAREAWQAAGYPVVGAAVARRAARELEDGAGIASTSVAALLGHDGSRPATLPDRCVLVVDEAGMLPTRQLAGLLDAVEAARGKLVLVGDHRQLPAIEAGGAFRGLVHRGLAIELTENRRQVEAWERAALDHLREGRAEQALGLYVAHDRLAIDATAERSRERLVEDWSGAGDPGDAVMIAHRRADVGDLNARARERMRVAGRLGETELVLSGGSFAAGDHVVVKQNDPRSGVHNGERARVVGVDAETGRLALDCRGDRVILDPAFLQDRTPHGEPTLLHGYAITAHVAQGLTVDHAFVLVDESLNRELAYTALSRGRRTNRLYVALGERALRDEFAPADPHRGEPLARLTAALGRSSAGSLALDARGTTVDDEVAAAERALREARERRRALESSRGRWLPGRRAELETTRQGEAAAAERLRGLRRRHAERALAARPFVSEQDLEARAALQSVRLAEQRFERSLDRGRGLGR